jgi:hypothetical protein
MRDLYLMSRLLRAAAAAVATVRRHQAGGGSGSGETHVRTLELPYTVQLELFVALHALLRLARRRPEGWRSLAALPRLPFAAPPAEAGAHAGGQHQHQPSEETAAVVTLFDMASTLDGEGQLLCLRLLELATAGGDDDDDAEEREEGRREGAQRIMLAAEEDGGPLESEQGAEDREGDAAQEFACHFDKNPQAVALLVRAGRLAAPAALRWVRDIVLGSPLGPARTLASLLLRRCWSGLSTAARAAVVSGVARSILPALPREGARGEPAWALVLYMCEHGVVVKEEEGGTAVAAASEGATALFGTLLRVLPAQHAVVENHPKAPLYMAVLAAAKLETPGLPPPRYCLE